MVQPDCNVMVVPHGRNDEGGLHVHAHNDRQLLVCTSDCHFTRATKVFDPFSEPTSTPVEQIQRIVSFFLRPKANSKSTISSRDCRTQGGNEIPTTQPKCTLVALSAATNTSPMALSDSFYNCCVSESEAICMSYIVFFGSPPAQKTGPPHGVQALALTFFCCIMRVPCRRKISIAHGILCLSLRYLIHPTVHPQHVHSTRNAAGGCKNCLWAFKYSLHQFAPGTPCIAKTLVP